MIRVLALAALALAACDRPTARSEGPAMSNQVTTRDAAYAIALAAVQAEHPGVAFALRDETTGGGRTPPWAFSILPASREPGDQIPGLGPVLVEYGSGKIEFLRPQPRALKLIVGDWEIAKYGALQR